MGPIRNPNWSTSGMRVTLSYLAQYIQCKKKKSWTPLPNLFHRVTGNPKHTIIFLGLVCMYLLSHVCIKNIFDLPDA